MPQGVTVHCETIPPTIDLISHSKACKRDPKTRPILIGSKWNWIEKQYGRSDFFLFSEHGKDKKTTWFSRFSPHSTLSVESIAQLDLH